MPTPEATRDLIDKQVRRCIRAILEGKEATVDEHLPENVRAEFRKLVQDEVRAMGAVVSHIAESAAEGYELNELAQDVRAIRAELQAAAREAPDQAT